MCLDNPNRAIDIVCAHLVGFADAHVGDALTQIDDDSGSVASKDMDMRGWMFAHGSENHHPKGAFSNNGWHRSITERLG